MTRRWDDLLTGTAPSFAIFRSGFLPREVWSELVNARGDGKHIDAMMNEHQYEGMKQAIRALNTSPIKAGITCVDIPGWVSHAIRNSSLSLSVTTFRYLKDLENRGLKDVVSQILPFQFQGLQFGVSKNGRCLIADEMGLGKSLQALMIAYEYSTSDWPLLIICPSSIRFVWKQQIAKWFGGLINPSVDVQVITKGKDPINPRARIIIVPYMLLATNEHLRVLPGKKPFQCVICDESHYIKDSSSKRSNVVLSILKKANRAILLSGTPSMNNADELYPQIMHLFPKNGSIRAPTLAEYRSRYCVSTSFTPKNSSYPITKWSGSQYREELNSLLLSTVMIRRMKKDVLTQLPEKIRQRVDLDIGESKWCMELQQMTRRWIANSGGDRGSHIGGGSNQSLESMELWRATGAAKLHSVKEYLSDLFTSNESSTSNLKCIIFAHHKFVLDGIEDLLLNGTSFVGPGKFIRIDGSVSQDQRSIRVTDFQSNPDCRVALLSITACAEGITLTAANLVLFAELYWVPGVIEQAEARAHRVGQRDSVYCQYLICPASPDEVVFSMLEKKKKDTSAILDGRETGLIENEAQQGLTDIELAQLVDDDALWMPMDGEVTLKRPRISD